jgi:electron transfer flavoprotein beta subunit
MNPFDELSIEESVRIREKKRYPGGVEEIIALSIGPPKSMDILRTAMAMGADRSIFIETKDGEEVEPLAVGKIIQKLVEREKVNLVMCGKQSIDDDSGQTGQIVAGLMGWGAATQASKVSFEGEGVVVEREVDGGTETVRSKLPMVITTDLRLNEPRYASLPNIMKAKKKKIDKITAEELGVSLERRLKTLKVIGELYI